MSPDGTGLTRLTNDPGADLLPAWSPNGSKIAFVRDPGGNPDIYVMNADGSAVKRLSSYPGEDLDPAWAPAGV